MNGRRLRAELLQNVDEDVTRQVLAGNDVDLLSADVEIKGAAQFVSALEKRESRSGAVTGSTNTSTIQRTAAIRAVTTPMAMAFA